jgi:biotin synthase-like enzyme
VTTAQTERPVGVDLLEHAQDLVLRQGIGLAEADLVEVLRLPEERTGELLALAHAVRMAWCGPEVEVEGIVSLKTGGCPEDCHFCSQSGLFESPVRSVWLDIPALVEAARQTADRCDGHRRLGVLHRRSGPRSRRAADEPAPRRCGGDQGRRRHQRGGQPRHPHP